MKSPAHPLLTAATLYLGLPALFVRGAGATRKFLASQEDAERGDVPGWVMITLMSAILVAGLLAIASPALEDLFEQAMAKVGN
ncbi:hypothetical protein AB0N65_04550 [Paenarthrobacter sp. NPDC089322]|uniref:hypothetical protein n=1 Tax=Paenarthrobacter sp. NPDC089322 TaxID=3155065 RepID=UPI003417DF07